MTGDPIKPDPAPQPKGPLQHGQNARAYLVLDRPER